MQNKFKQLSLWFSLSSEPNFVFIFRNAANW